RLRGFQESGYSCYYCNSASIQGSRASGPARASAQVKKACRVTIVNLLALDTSTRHAAMAVGRADGAVFVAPGHPSTGHGRGLIPALRDLMREAGLQLTDLDGLAVGLGPGSFTGLRVGVTAVKTLAYACGKPLVGLDSMEIVARNAPAEALLVAAAADA